MFSTRLAQQSLRWLAVQHPSAVRTSVLKLASPAAVAAGKHVQMRPATSSSAPATESADQNEILTKQRLNRPVSPHLTIYKFQIPWIMSSLNRLSGVVLAGSLYLFTPAYLAAPLLGWHLESASMVAAFGALPIVAKVLIKFGLALPFTFHGLNGLRHLTWDLGKQLTNKQVIVTGWTVTALTVASSLALAMW